MGVTLGGVGDPFFMLEALGVGGIQNARAGEDAIDLLDESKIYFFDIVRDIYCWCCTTTKYLGRISPQLPISSTATSKQATQHSDRSMPSVPSTSVQLTTSPRTAKKY